MTVFFRGFTLDRGGDVPDIPCGTAACMAGWACTIPAFARQGLTAAVYGSNYIVPAYGTDEGFTALEAFFDITSDECEYLFDNIGGSVAGVPARRDQWGPLDAVAHLDAFIERYAEVKDYLGADEPA